MRFSFLLLLTALPACSQIISVGVKAGVPLTQAYSDVRVASGAASSFQNHYIVGPTVEIHLPLHLSFEADALYRRSGFGVSGASTGAGNAAVNDWQIPLLGKYEAPLGPVRPFVDAGVVYRHVSASNLPFFLDSGSQDSTGFAVGGGIGLKVLHIRLSPEIRYTHWGQLAFSNIAVLSNGNQADFLVGLTF